MRGLLLLIAFFISFGLLKAQISDDFNDGDFTFNPIWTGNVALFLIDAGQLRSNSPGLSNYYLSTPSTLATNVNWEFLVNLKFGTSGVNYVDVYLTADVADLNSVSNGYFIRIGGTNDEIVLYKKEGGTNTALISSITGIVNSTSSNPFFIRVSRDNSDLWTLYIDDGNLGSLTEIGSIVDNTINTSSNFGILITQSGAVSPINNHFFDNILVETISKDNSPPTLNTVVVNSAKQLILTFSEPLDQNIAENLNNYNVVSIGPPTIALLSSINQIIITYVNDLPNGDYTLEVSNIEDLNGNVLSVSTLSFTIFTPDVPVLRDVVFSEIFPDPSPPIGLPEDEFVELYNKSNKTFDLEGWKFSDATNAVILPSFILEPSEYVIVCAESNVSLFQSFGSVIGVSGFPTLNNASDNLTLRNVDNSLIDSLAYSDTWYQSEDIKAGGFTLELINPNNTCGGIENWIASVDSNGGTPGTINSVNNPDAGSELPLVLEVRAINANQIRVTFSESLDGFSIQLADFNIDQGIILNGLERINSDIFLSTTNDILFNQNYILTISSVSDCTGNQFVTASFEFLLLEKLPAKLKDVIITELMADFSPPIGLPEAEFIELYNNSDKTFDLEGWRFSDATNTVILPSFILEPSEYVIISAPSNIALFQSFGNIIGVNSFPTLNNASDNLTLKNMNNSLVDSLAYSDSWYQNEEKKAGGFTLELINPNNTCGGIENWIASVDSNGGTPGTINSVNNPGAGSELPLVLEVRAINANLIRITFSEPLDSLTIQLADFTIDHAIIINGLERIDSDIFLSTTNDILFNQTYTLTISSVSDCTGNPFIMDEFDFLLFENPIVVYNDIIISEIMANPSEETSVVNVEYVELFNRSDNSVNIENWTIADDSREGRIPYFILNPNEYVVLSSDANTTLFPVSIPVLGVSSFPSLNNAGDSIKLSDQTGFLLDEAVYNSNWYRSSIKEDGGYSLEIIDPNNICDEDENWIASEDKSGGTPGTVNSVFSNMPDNIGPEIVSVFGISPDSVLIRFNEKIDESSVQMNDFLLSNELEIAQIVIEDLKTLYLVLNQNTLLQSGKSYSIKVKNIKDCPGNSIGNILNQATFSLIEEANKGDLLSNEILFNPRPGGIDFVEIYNNSSKFISLKNWLLANGKIIDDTLIVETKRLISTNELIIGPGEYRVFTSDAIILKSQYPDGYESNFIEIASLPSYSDNEGIVVLINSKNDMVDYFHYSEDLHSKVITDNEGVSLERISFEENTNEPNNWISAVKGVGYATPGYLNSQMRKDIANEKGSITIDPKVIVPDGSGQRDFATISYLFDQSGFVANISVMDLQGRKIKSIASNDYLGAEGFYTWDGTDDGGQIVRLGYYIVYVEVFNSAGTVKTFKENVVVGTRF